MSVRVATFNVENLFARYRFRGASTPVSADGFTINKTAFKINNQTEKKITAAAIRSVNADILCLQEVENLEVLDRFNTKYLQRMNYTHRLVIDSHDPRRIDVGILSRYPFSSIRTHRHERNQANTGWKFSRDCLEVIVDIDGTPLHLYVNHFKSMIGGRNRTMPKRTDQVVRVAEIIDQRWRDDDYLGNYIVLGDFNDYIDAGTSLTALVGHTHLENVVARLPENERWTHYYARGREYRQLDYLLLSKALAEANNSAPGIERRGLPPRAARYTGPRFRNVTNRYKASDHCPVYIDIELVRAGEA